MFQEAYGSDPNPTDYGKALAVFQRHFIVTGPSPFDRYASGDASAMEESAVRGIALFKGKANGIACHNGPNFTDSRFHNVGLAHNPILDDRHSSLQCGVTNDHFFRHNRLNYHEKKR